MGNLGIYIEILVLYIILFFSGSLGAANYLPPVEFSASAEIYRIILYYIPSLTLIWLLLLRGRNLSIKKGDSYAIIDTVRKPSILPVKNDIISGIIALPALLITGFSAAFIAARVSGQTNESLILLPSSVKDWIALGFTCLFAAYLEESFFRYYLLTKSNILKLNHIHALFFSTVLFSICHIYEGQWGVLNAAISSAVLCFLFLRYNAFHGIAIAHGLYNICVYIIMSVQMR